MGITEIVPVEMLPKRPYPKPQTATGKVDRLECRMDMVFPTPGRPPVTENHDMAMVFDDSG
jgi:hypothetical protein